MIGTAFVRTTLVDMMDRKNQKPRIKLVMQFYDPEPVYKGQAFAEAISNAGYDVEVITGFPNYPGGKVYEGFRIRPIQKQCLNGIKITRLALYPSHDKSKIGRILNYLSFAFSVFLYLTVAARRTDLVYVYSPPATVGISAAAAGCIRRFPIVVDIHDLWPDTLPATGMLTNPKLLKVIDVACNWMYRRVRHVILHSHGFRERLIERGVPPEKMTAIWGWTDETGPDVVGSGSELIGQESGLSVLYAGNIGPAQALDTVIDAAEQLHAAGDHDKVTFYLLGSGLSHDALKQKVHSKGLTNVVFLPRVTKEEVGNYLSAADALLVHLRDDPLFTITMPSKAQAYMLAGRPILMGVSGEARSLIETANAGISFPPQNSQKLAEAVKTLADMSQEDRQVIGKNAQEYYWENLSMEKGMAKFLKVFNDVRHAS